MEKMTNVTALMMVMEIEEVKANTILLEKLAKMKAQFERKNSSGEGKMSKTQKENLPIKEAIVDFLTEYKEPIQIKEMLSLTTTFKEISGQKASALLKQLVDEGRVTKTIEKKVTKFQIKLGV